MYANDTHAEALGFQLLMGFSPFVCLAWDNPPQKLLCESALICNISAANFLT